MYNKIILIGRVGSNPEIRSFDSGSSITNISVATSESWKDKSSGEWKEKTIWHRVSVLGVTAGYVQRNVKKGDLVAIEGQQDNRKYEKDGVVKYISEVKVAYGGSVQKILTGTNETNNHAQPVAYAADNNEDDIPF